MYDITLPNPKSLFYIKSLLYVRGFKGTLSQLLENQYCEEGLCIGLLPSGLKRSPIAQSNCLRMGVYVPSVLSSFSTIHSNNCFSEISSNSTFN